MRHELLTREQEIFLGRRIQNGLRIERDIKERAKIAEENHYPQTYGTDQELRDIEDGEAAAKELVRYNLRLVVPIAKKYLGSKMHLLDLIQEGNIGLMKAALKYNPELGYRFSTVAVWWITQSITHAIANQSTAIRLPEYMHESIRTLRRVSEQFNNKHNRPPTNAELAQILATDVEHIRLMFEAEQKKDITSLDQKIRDEDSTIGLFIEDKEKKDAQQAAEAQDIRQKLSEHLKHLPERQRLALIMRFGIGIDKPLTLQEIGDYLGITKEAVRQNVAKALRKLNTKGFREQIEDYLG